MPSSRHSNADAQDLCVGSLPESLGRGRRWRRIKLLMRSPCNRRVYAIIVLADKVGLSQREGRGQRGNCFGTVPMTKMIVRHRSGVMKVLLVLSNQYISDSTAAEIHYPSSPSQAVRASSIINSVPSSTSSLPTQAFQNISPPWPQFGTAANAAMARWAPQTTCPARITTVTTLDAAHAP